MQSRIRVGLQPQEGAWKHTRQDGFTELRKLDAKHTAEGYIHDAVATPRTEPEEKRVAQQRATCPIATQVSAAKMRVSNYGSPFGVELRQQIMHLLDRGADRHGTATRHEFVS